MSFHQRKTEPKVIGKYSFRILCPLSKRAFEYVGDSMRSAWEGYLERDCQLTPAEMERLGNHKYSASDVSWLDDLFMKRLPSFYSSKFT